MDWKNIKQRSMNDRILIQHKALTELDDILTLQMTLSQLNINTLKFFLRVNITAMQMVKEVRYHIWRLTMVRHQMYK
jgi:hypothetical protein